MTSATFLDQQRADMMEALYERSGRDQLRGIAGIRNREQLCAELLNIRQMLDS